MIVIENITFAKNKQYTGVCIKITWVQSKEFPVIICMLCLPAGLPVKINNIGCGLVSMNEYRNVYMNLKYWAC